MAAEPNEEVDDEELADTVERAILALHGKKKPTKEERQQALDSLKIAPNKDVDDPTFGRRFG